MAHVVVLGLDMTSAMLSNRSATDSPAAQQHDADGRGAVLPGASGALAGGDEQQHPIYAFCFF